MTSQAFPKQAARAALLLKNLANAKRLMILCSLQEKECSVSALEEKIGLTQSALSQHLARLRAAGLVKARRAGQTVFYRLDGKEAASILRALDKLYCAPGPAVTKKRPLPKTRGDTHDH